MFEHLEKFPRILVTGPQRSGTRIAATMIAEDTGHWFVGEEGIGVDSLNRLWRTLVTGRDVVIQAPCLMRDVPMLVPRVVLIFQPLLELAVPAYLVRCDLAPYLRELLAKILIHAENL